MYLREVEPTSKGIGSIRIPLPETGVSGNLNPLYHDHPPHTEFSFYPPGVAIVHDPPAQQKKTKNSANQVPSQIKKKSADQVPKKRGGAVSTQLLLIDVNLERGVGRKINGMQKADVCPSAIINHARLKQCTVCTQKARLN